MKLAELRKTFLAGLLVLTPVALTFFILTWLFRLIDVNLREWVFRTVIEPRNYADWIVRIPGLGLLVIFALIILVGVIARNYFGRKLLDIGDFIVTRIPLVNRIYIAIREISEAVLSEKREVFKKAVLIEYPRKGAYSVAFFTQDTQGEVQDHLEEDVVSLFVPTTPNPTSGFLLFIPKKDIKMLDMSVEDALKLVISGGSVNLKNKRSPDPFRKPDKRLKQSGPLEQFDA